MSDNADSPLAVCHFQPYLTSECLSSEGALSSLDAHAIVTVTGIV
jgi:hypothetical protein